MHGGYTITDGMRIRCSDVCCLLLLFFFGGGGGGGLTLFRIHIKK